MRSAYPLTLVCSSPDLEHWQLLELLPRVLVHGVRQVQSTLAGNEIDAVLARRRAVDVLRKPCLLVAGLGALATPWIAAPRTRHGVHQIHEVDAVLALRHAVDVLRKLCLLVAGLGP